MEPIVLCKCRRGSKCPKVYTKNQDEVRITDDFGNDETRSKDEWTVLSEGYDGDEFVKFGGVSMLGYQAKMLNSM